MGKLRDNASNYENHHYSLVKNVLGHVKEAVKTSARIENERVMRSYFRIPTDISGCKRKLFTFLKRG